MQDLTVMPSYRRKLGSRWYDISYQSRVAPLEIRAKDDLGDEANLIPFLRRLARRLKADEFAGRPAAEQGR